MHGVPVVAAFALLLAACSLDDDLIQGAITEPDSLEQMLGLVPQTINATELTGASNTVDGARSRYMILSTESGAIDLESMSISRTEGEPSSLLELFPQASPARAMGLLERDALLLISVPEDHVDKLCERFQFAHDEADLLIEQDEQLLFTAPAADGQAHALCLLPATVEGSEDGNASAKDDTMSFGSGAYTVWVKELLCRDPRDWENWPYNGDEARLRAFYNGNGGSQIWGANDVESGDRFYPNRFIHFSSNAKLELYDYDSSPWNASDKLGQEYIYSGEACSGDHYADFDGSGGGHNWNYDLTYRVFGPNCPCQSNVPAVYSNSQVETCTITSSTITSYTHYCSGGTYWRQAWGNVTRHCETYNKKYNTACEMNTFVSQTLVSECNKYQTGVAIGSPTAVGTCPEPDPCHYAAAEEPHGLKELPCPLQ